jgi:NitT/TauT family transport system substrate-binding protein
VALEKGFYQNHGLAVTLVPGGPEVDPVKVVASQTADIGQAGGIEQVIQARTHGFPILAFATIHRDTPHALISLERNPIRNEKDLPGKRIAVAYGDAAEVLFKAYLRKAHVDPASITMVPFRFDLSQLTNGEVDAVTGFKTDQPASLRVLGFPAVVLSYSSQGIRSYGYTLFTTEAFRGTNETVIQAFNSASREGFAYTFAHPQEAIAILKKWTKAGFNEKSERRKLELISTLMVDTDGILNDWNLDTERVQGVEEFLRGEGQLKQAPEIDTIFRNLPR